MVWKFYVVRAALLLLAYVLTTGAALAASDPFGLGGSASLASKPIYWWQGDIKQHAWMALDEAAVLRGRSTASSRYLPLRITDQTPAQEIIYESDSIAFISLNSPLNGQNPRESLPQYASRGIQRPVSPIFYPGRTKETLARMALSGEVIAKFKPHVSDAEIQSLEKQFSLRRMKTLPYAEKLYIYSAADPLASLDAANGLYETGKTIYSHPNWYRTYEYCDTPGDPLFPDQWHLYNTGQNAVSGSTITPGEDINALEAWSARDSSGRPIRGDGQVIAIVDSGVDIYHEDLVDNVLTGRSWNFENENTSIIPNVHGTMIAGVACARGFDRAAPAQPLVGGTGVAPHAQFVSHQITSADVFLWTTEMDSIIADSFYRNSQNLVDIYVFGFVHNDESYLYPANTVVPDAVKAAVNHGRPGSDGKALGPVYVIAAGNSGYSWLRSNSNLNAITNLRQMIAVTATNDAGRRAPYAEPGANILVNAPSGGGENTQGITTTYSYHNEEGGLEETNPAYTSGFSGTSAAAAQVAGAAALILQANPDLSWRDVRHILIESAERNDPGHSDWTTNGAGHYINHYYGFGRLDVGRAVSLAKNWTTAEQELVAEGAATPNRAIPDNNAQGVSSTITITRELHVEFVEVYFSSTDHTNWEDLEIVLTSPQGTESVLVETRFKDLPDLDEETGQPLLAYDNWRFGTVRHYEELSQGAWTLTVRDNLGQDTGTFQKWSIRIYGADASTTPVGQKSLAVQTSGDGNGLVTSTPAGIDCGSDCSDSFYEDSLVTLLATPNPGSVFAGWSPAGLCNDSSSSCDVLMDLDRTITAVFNRDSDADGVYDSEEAGGLNNGDANGNGVQDSLEANVVSFKDANGAYNALIAASDLFFTDFALAEVGADATVCENEDELPAFPVGVVSFVLQKGGFPVYTAEVSWLTPANQDFIKFSYLSQAEDDSQSCWKTEQFIETGGASISQEGDLTRITLRLQDGAFGDSKAGETDNAVIFKGGPGSEETFNPDTDNDGVADIYEDDGLANGDVNNNFIKDSSEAYVANNINGDGNYALVAPSDSAFTSTAARNNPSRLTGPEEIEYIASPSTLDFIDFKLTQVTPGGCVDVTLLWPLNSLITTYYIYGPTPSNTSSHWEKFSYDGKTGVKVSQGETYTSIVMHLCDGQRGDLDLDSTNGIILNLGAPFTELYDETLDYDNDGIPNNAEWAGPNSGDADENGVDDATEARVASYLAVDSAGISTYQVGVVAEETGETLSKVTPVLVDNVSGLSNKLTMPAGAIDYYINGVEAGQCTQTVQLFVSAIIPEISGGDITYYTYTGELDRDDDGLHEFTSDGQTGFTLFEDTGRSRFVLDICDGGRGDADGAKNGVIRVFGGPVVERADGGSGGGNTDYKAGSSGGGCTVNPHAEHGAAWLLLLAGALLLLCRKRS